MNRFKTATVRLACALGLLTGCTGTVDGDGGIGDHRGSVEWTKDDQPSLFTADLEYQFDKMPAVGEAERIPWAGYYWSTYNDNINNRWAGETSDSPAAKYGKAFGVEGVEDAVSKEYGIDSQSHRTACTERSQCQSGESCSKRDGAESGYCIPTWFGICHAWAPAAILHQEPERSVTRNGVTFEIQDIKALLTLGYDQTDSRFVSKRCNDNDAKGDIEYDEYGRPNPNGDCIDTNPATFHILIANYLGLRGESFVYDRTYDDEVWNQPLRGYRTLSQSEVTAQEANELIGVPAEESANGYLFNDKAVAFQHLEVAVEYITESPASRDGNLSSSIDNYTNTDYLDYVLELDGEGRLIGGEWVGRSKRNHPDFLWLPTGRGASPLAQGKIAWREILSIYNESVGNTVVTETLTLGQGEWAHFGPFDTKTATSFSAELSGNGDADLYVRRGATPDEEQFDCRPYDGGSDESCTVPAGGPVFVSIFGYDTAELSLDLSFSPTN